MKPITLEEAKQLKSGTILYEINKKNADGSARRWKVFGKVQTWTRDEKRISIPLKRGLYEHSHLTENNLWAFSLKQ